MISAYNENYRNKITVGENDYEDIKTTVMDPNTRMLIKVKMSDLENDEKIFQLLRGGSPVDLAGRKHMVRTTYVDKELIDT